MAHIPEGILSGNIVATGYLLTSVLSLISAKKINCSNVPKVSLVTAAVFCASLLHFPIMGTSVHFSFVGLAGMLLGPLAFLSVSVAVLFQFLFFQHGGLSSLGINIFNMGTAALFGWLVFSLRHRFHATRKATAVFSFLAGFISTLVLASLLSAALFFTNFPKEVAIMAFTAHIPLIFLEGIVTGFVGIGLYKIGKEYLYG